MIVEGCNNIQAALAGQDVEVDARFAAEFGSGSVQFVAGHLASVSFVVKAPFNDVVEDMTAKLNANPQLGCRNFSKRCRGNRQTAQSNVDTPELPRESFRVAVVGG